MKRFKNRTVIVTGAARGMGASHARGFVAEGANVVIADVSIKKDKALPMNSATAPSSRASTSRAKRTGQRL
jgi:NAD(P)-dependent dehydrogenase (short-subunit alcohol dehydrogenase family)